MKRKYTVNSEFFKYPNPVNCYWAGFIAADGCICKNLKELRITLAEKDSDHLEYFRNNIDYSGPIYHSCSERYSSCTIAINNEEICRDLYDNFNITPSKSLTLQPPKIHDLYLIDCFIRGYIDGDGSIFWTNVNELHGQKKLNISVTGTKDLLEFIGKRCAEIGNCHYHIQKPVSTEAYYLSFSQSRNLFMHLYKLSVPVLERKWNSSMYKWCSEWIKLNPKEYVPSKGVNIFKVDGTFIKSCKSLTEASNIVNIRPGRISEVCDKLCSNGKPRTAHGYIFTRHINYPIQQI